MKIGHPESSVIESSDESSVDHKPVVRKYCILQGKCNLTMDKLKNLKSMVNKPWKKKKSNKEYAHDKTKSIALIEKKFQKYVKIKKRRKSKKEFRHLQISDDEEDKMRISSVAEIIESGEITSSNSE